MRMGAQVATEVLMGYQRGGSSISMVSRLVNQE